MVKTMYVLWNHRLQVWLRCPEGGVTGVEDRAARFEFATTAELKRLDQTYPSDWEVRVVAFDSERNVLVKGGVQ